jgi:hypothetical protein
MDWRYAQGVVYLLCKHKALSSNPNPTHKTKGRKEGGREGEKEGGKEEDSNGAWNWKPSKPGVPSLLTLPISASS